MTNPTTTHQLIGRARELERVTDALAAGRPILIIGEPGIGKTALARAGAQALDPPRIWEGGGIATLDWMSYLPYRRALGLPLPDGDASVVADFLADQAEGGLFIVDDLQWVDHDTVTATLLLAERAPVIATTRPVPHGDDVRVRLAAARFEVIDLAPLAEEDAAALARDQNPSLTASDATSVARRAGGNPLLVQGFAHARDDTSELALAMRARLAELSPAARDALLRVAVLERPARLDLARSDLHQLLGMGLVTETRDGVQVRHALIADAVLGDLAADVLQGVHRSVAQHLDDAGEAARHWAAAGDREQARRLALEAAQTATRPAESARCGALAALCLSGPDRDRELVNAMARLAALSDFATVVDLSAEVAPGSPYEPEACRLRARGLFETHDFSGADDAIARGLAAAREVDDEAAEVRLRITGLYHDLWSMDTRASPVNDLIRRAEELGVADAEMRVEAAVALAISMTPEAVDLAHSARELARSEGHAWAEQESWAAEATALNNLGHWQKAYDATRIGEADLLARGYHATAARLRASRADQMVWECEYETTLTLTEDLLARPGLLAGSWDVTLWSRALALSDTGDTTAAESLLRQLDGRVLPSGEYWLAWVRAEMLLGRGDARAAVAFAQQALELAYIDLMRPQTNATLARAQWECDLPVLHEGYRHETHISVAFSAELDGLAALQSGDAGRAVEHFERAVARGAWRRHRFRFRLGLAEALDLVDPDRATATLQSLADDLRAVGWVTFLTRVEGLLQAPPGGRRLQAPKHDAPGPLTPREHDVLSLVADGLTSRRIAERLGVSPATVESHVRAAMQKLGTRTRAEAAALIRDADGRS